MSLAALRALLNKASPGPWRVEPNGCGSYGEPDMCPTYVRDAPPGDTDGYVVASIVGDCVPQHATNATLIVALRNLAPALIEAAEALADARVRLECWNDTLSQHRVITPAALKAEFDSDGLIVRIDAALAALEAKP